MGLQKMKKRMVTIKRLFAGTLATIMGLSPMAGTMTVQAAGTSVGEGSYSTEIVGQYSYNDASGNPVYVNNSTLAAKLPYKGSKYRFTTDNYDANNGAFDTTNWASSFMWALDGNQTFSSQVYAIPLAYKGESYGLQVTAPSALSDTANKVYTMQMAENGTLTDFYIKTGFTSDSAKVDAVTDWSYDIIWENASNKSQKMKATLVQGVPFTYFEMINTDTLTVERGGKSGLPSAVVSKSDDGSYIVVRCFDNGDEDYDYYAFYASQGTSWNISEASNGIKSMTANFPSGKEYASMAYLGSVKSNPDDAWAISTAKEYSKYAYNFITDTKATYSYNEKTSTVTTKYAYTFDKKSESTANGTIMGILPHQYKSMSGASFADYTYQTVRGLMKTITGSSFTTNQTYSGILPYMPSIEDEYNDELLAYLDEYTTEFGDNYFKNYEGCGDTYWDGKGLNRLVNAMVAAEDAGDTETATKLLNALKTRLEDWLTYSGSNDDAYFYYDEGVGSLFGFPQSYSSVDQINDHHFHYGYFIYAAAQVAMRVDNWGDDNQYGAMVKELIYDIACPERNSADSRYPYLRSFAPYEGHSWASGHQNFGMGNNQESSSEALNAWAGIILYGEATGDDELRDLGVYLYTTEVAAVNNYWFDVDEDVLSDAYRYGVPNAQVNSINKETDEVKYNSAAIVWGGSYTYATWFSANPLHIQGINLLPMNPTGFYLAGDKDYIEENIRLAYKYAAQGNWSDKEWIDIWCQYQALADPETALERWEKAEAEGYGVEGGETKAHTYHFIRSLNRYGTPDTSITGDCALSTVFVKDGVKTYAAYNNSDQEITVTFSDGAKITVAANSMYAGPNGSSGGTEPIEPNPGNPTDPTDPVEPVKPVDETQGFTYENGKATFYYKDATEGVVYVAAYDTKSQAEEVAEKANADKPGFSHVTGHSGHTLKADGDYAKADYTVAEGKYLVYAFNPDHKGVGEWKVDVAQAKQDTSNAKYTVKYYLENTDCDGYELKDSTELESAIGETVSATTKSYTGFTYNESASNISGTVSEDGSLELSVYYDRNSYDIDYKNVDGATNNNADSYIYGVGADLKDAVKSGYEFNGWYSDADLTKAVTSISTSETGAKTLYAKWTKKSNDTTPITKDYGFTYDASSEKATFFCNGASTGVVYVAAYDTKSQAEEIADKANANAPGFSCVTGHGGYNLKADGDCAKADYTVASGKYLVYAFNPDNEGVSKWYVGVASETTNENPDETPVQNSEVSYDAASKKAVFACEGAKEGIVYVAGYDSESEAKEIVDKANANAPGFEYVTGHSGYMLKADGDYAKAEINTAGKKYLVYAFNPDFAGVQEWKLFCAE